MFKGNLYSDPRDFGMGQTFELYEGRHTMADTYDGGSGPVSIAIYAVIGAIAAGSACYVAIGVSAAVVAALLGAIGGGLLGGA